ncbi:MAG: ATP-binding protein [Candidatus Margulisiibacteriota bacterium]
MLLSVEELRKILKFGEGETIEFKKEIPDVPDLAKQFAAFSNTRGGWVLIGVDDKKKIVGLKAGEKEKQVLVNVARNNCQPHIAIKCDFLEVGRKKLLVAYISEGGDKPYQANGKIYVRIGSHIHVASGEEIRKLIYESGRLYYEKRPVIEADLGHLDDKKIRKYIREILNIKKKLKEEELIRLLVNIGVLVQEGRKVFPTIAGILLFGKYPQGFLPTATLKAYFFSGKEKDARFVKDKEDIEGTLPEVIDKALAFIKKNRRIIPDMTGIRRRDIPAYPDYSSREILANAVAHRDYSLAGAKIEVLMFDDRMEIISPGNLPPSISIERLGIEHYSRNPLIAKVLNQLDYIEEIGMGIKRVREEMASLRLPLPSFENEGINFKVTFLCPKISEEFEKKEVKLNKRQLLAIEYIKKIGKITNREYSTINNIGRVYAFKELSDLVRRGVVKKVGKGRSIYYVVSD